MVLGELNATLTWSLFSRGFSTILVGNYLTKNRSYLKKLRTLFGGTGRGLFNSAGIFYLDLDEKF
jgi:hypothetical protein